jgi:hypothetical protein
MMMRIFSTMVWLLPLGLCGCPSDESCPSTPDLSPFSIVALLVVDEPVKLNLYPFENGGCAPPGVMPDSITAEITGPDGQPIPNESSMNLPSSLTGTVRFTLEKPGPHHFLTAFEPVGGLLQFDLHAARDRSSEAAMKSLSSACTTLERTDLGSWVCNSQVFRGDQSFLLNLPSGRIAVAGNVVWVAGGQQIHRYVDTGTKLELSATLSHTEGAAAFLLASPDELLVLHAQSLLRVAFDGTALVFTGRTAWAGAPAPIDNNESLQGLLLRTGSGLALVSRAKASEAQSLQACAYQLEASGMVRTAEPCQPLTGMLLGYERSVLWMGALSPGTRDVEALHHMEWTGSRLETRGSLIVGSSLQITRSGTQGSTSIPVLAGAPYEIRGLPIRAGVPVYRPEEGQVSLELLDKEITQPSASSTLLWGAPKSGTGSRIRLRPTAP